MEPSARPRLPGWACAGLALAATIAGGWLGLHLGERFGYGVAWLTDRDIAELKDMLIWCILSGAIVCAVAGVWLALRLTRSRAWAQRSALVALGVVTLGAAGIVLAAYPSPKSSGIPVVAYELRLPPDLPFPVFGNIGLTIWSQTSGQGCYIEILRMASERAEIVGSMVLQTSNLSPTLTRTLNQNSEGHWRLPVKPDAALDKSFGPWQRIEFIAPRRANVAPLPPGDYQIRYRVRRYM